MDWVDVFAPGPLAGNPLAVVTGGTFPPATVMQRMAAELGLSETVFACPGSTPALRIFTPADELPLAGHPLVGTAWVLRRIGWIADHATLSTPAGHIAVRADAQGAAMVRHGPRQAGRADLDALTACLGGQPRADAPIWNAGLPQVMLEVHDLDDLRPDHAAIRAQGLREGWAGVSAYVLHDRRPDTVIASVRHFAAPIGIPEDPVTGSAAGALGARLAAAGMRTGDGELQLRVRQGQHLGRPGEVRVRVRTGDDGPVSVEVGGAVVPIIEGAVLDGVLQG